MARGMIIGGTDFSSQSIGEIKKELENWITGAKEVDTSVREIRDELNQKFNGYYDEYATYNFQGSVEASLLLYQSVIEGSTEILHGLDNGFKEYHVKIARNISNSAHTQHQTYRAAWKDDMSKYDYESPSFHKLERIYAMGSDMLGDLYDFGNLAHRLDDFVGRNCRNESTILINNISGDNNNVKNQDNTSITIDNSSDNSITVGNENKLKRSLIGHNKKDENKEDPIIFSIIKGVMFPVIAAAIIYYFGFN